MNEVTTRLSVPDVSCASCQRAIAGAVAPLSGVRSVEVDVHGKVVAVEHDPHFPVGRIVRAIEEQGYTVGGHDGTPDAAA